MSLTDQDVAHVAMLARLGLSPEERAQLGAQLSAILEHISMLDRFDTAAVPETAQPGGLHNVFREDERQGSLDAETALSAAPEREGPYFQVGAIQE